MTLSSAQKDFSGLGIAPEILTVVDGLQFKVPTMIQQKAIPAAIEGKDVLGIAQTGTGKTLAFGIPMIQRLIKNPLERALILVPTRELALQVDETMRKIGNPFNIRSVIVIGGMDMTTQVKLLGKKAIRVIIATPGRFMDHMEQKTTDASDIQMAVLDEADRMLDMGFAPQVERLAKFLPKERQTLLFSATMPESVMRLVALYMKEPVRIEASLSGAAPEKIIQELFIVEQDSKLKLLGKLLVKFKGSVLIFTRTKATTWKLARSLQQMGHTANELHSDRTQGERRHALKGFKEGTYRILVATDIAARGIDVQGIELVINFDLPDETENYIHRIGRTGRAGMKGHAISFATPKEGRDVRDIEALMRMPLQVVTMSGVDAQHFLYKAGAVKKKIVYENEERHKTGRPTFAPPPPKPMRPGIRPRGKKEHK